MQVPDHCWYNEFHLWCRKDGDSFLIGITDHAQHSLGEILYVEVPGPSDIVTKNQSFGIVESTKVVSELVSPLGGTVIEANASLAHSPDVLNRDPYVAGWLLRLRAVEEADHRDLMNAQQYAEFISGA